MDVPVLYSVVDTIAKRYGYEWDIEYYTDRGPFGNAKLWLKDPITNMRRPKKISLKPSKAELQEEIESIIAEFKSDIEKIEESEVENDECEEM